MATIKVTVTHPQTRVGGAAFDPATDLKNWRLFVQAQGASSWTQVGDDFPATETVKNIGNVAPGTWGIRVEWRDQYDQMAFSEVAAEVPLPGIPSAGLVQTQVLP